MRAKRSLLLLLCCLPLLITGCYDRRELEEMAMVLALGLDSGQQSRYAVTAVVAIPSKMAGGKGGGGEGKPTMLTTVEAPTVAGAIALLNTYIDRRISLMHLKGLFMAEDLAKESGLTVMDEFVRMREARRTIFYIVIKGKAAKFLDKMNPQLEKDPQRFIEQMTASYQRTGMIPAASQIQTFVTTVNTGYAQPLAYYAAIKEGEEGGDKGGGDKEKGGGEKGEGGGTGAVSKTPEGKDPESTRPIDRQFRAGEIPRKGGPNLEIIGAAAFRRDRMVGALSGQEMRLVLMLQNRFRRGIVTIPDPATEDAAVSVDLRRGKPTSITVSLGGSRPKIRGVVNLEGEITGMEGVKLDYTEPENQPKLEAALSSKLEGDIAALVKKTQDWNADVMGFGTRVVRQYPTVAAWEAADWPNHYKDADIQIDVQVTLRRFGLQLSPPRAAQ
ncbi:MAG: Ger(x)C family spore germination protein [Mycobacterium leprae]